MNLPPIDAWAFAPMSGGHDLIAGRFLLSSIVARRHRRWLGGLRREAVDLLRMLPG